MSNRKGLNSPREMTEKRLERTLNPK
jgi:hypothetical protein